jgi:hypothetical protein
MAQVLDYLSDYICVLYGTAGAYGVVTMPFSVREVRAFFSVFLLFCRYFVLLFFQSIHHAASVAAARV